MSETGTMRDLIVLVPDKNMEAAVRGLLSRPRSLHIRPVDHEVYVHPERDAGCLLKSQEFLRQFAGVYSRALVMLDHDGCGQENQTRESLERMIEASLSTSGWGQRARAVVIEPELEMWVWSDSPHVDSILGWRGRQPHLRDWLVSNGFSTAPDRKPSDPKAAVEAALRVARVPRSSSVYELLARRVGISRCVDPAFVKLKTLLRHWFTSPGTGHSSFGH